LSRALLQTTLLHKPCCKQQNVPGKLVILHLLMVSVWCSCTPPTYAAHTTHVQNSSLQNVLAKLVIDRVLSVEMVH
jgi:hypothetical protein